MTDEKQWRKFMDQKWAEYHRDRKEFNSKYGVEHLRPAPNLLSNLADKPKTKKAEEKRKPPATLHRQVRKPQAARTRASGSLGGLPKIPEVQPKHEFNIIKAGERRRELGRKVNPNEAELREYRDISNKIESELDKRQRQLNFDASKA